MDAFIRFLEGINEWIGRIFSWTVAVLTIIVVFEVVLRYLFNSPTVCNFEITKQLYGLYFMILAGYALLHGSHVSVDIFYARLSKRSKAIVDIISYIIFFFPFCVVILIYGTCFALDSWGDLETSWSACGCPLYPIKTIVAVSFLLIAIQGVAIFMKTLFSLIRGEGNA
jgi:TRAP-type mannitol/chloroaromatic compound transport system permease small subunit